MSAVPASPSRGFTLTELVVVMGIITILIGMAMPAMSLSMRRADANSTANVISLVHMAQVRNARQVGGGGTVYGFSIVYSSQVLGKITPAKYCATSIVPWYIVPDYSGGSYNLGSVGYTSAADLAQGIGGGIITGANSAITDGTNALVGIDFVDTQVPAFQINANSASYPGTSTQVLLTSIASSPTKIALHIAYEPGTGFVHAALNTTSSGIADALTAASNSLASGSTNLHLTNILQSHNPNQIEITLLSMGNGAATNRVILYQNGTYAIAGP